ncbi:hypothetical protein NQ317_013405 [Molorchus minor]|uniref:Uncharacterized protein n=1 Tax=Molorchus minor TaxID=1323400 RepID=A0ABQ9JU16_9CUCU|nr:hypothetical protein NQ317_013405 [Molorchus minor]
MRTLVSVCFCKQIKISKKPGTQIASKDLPTAFFKRNAYLSIRTAESTSLARAMNFNEENIGTTSSYKIFIMWTKQVVPLYKKPTKVLAKKGVKQVGSITFQERGCFVYLAVNAVEVASLRC